MQLSIGHWIVLGLGAFLVGFSKTGITGLGILAVAMFALALPAVLSTGAILPILISGDIVAVSLYRRHAVWSHLWRLVPWAATGIVCGAIAVAELKKAVPDHIQADHFMSRVIGAIVLTIIGLHLWRQQKSRTSDGELPLPNTLWFAAIMGLLAGFTSMIANAAGPIMIIYLLSMRLPKMEFMGTGAWYFLLMNCFKVPFSAHNGQMDRHTLALDAVLLPFALLGTLTGRAVIHKIDQGLFESVALVLAVGAAVKLIW